MIIAHEPKALRARYAVLLALGCLSVDPAVATATELNSTPPPHNGGVASDQRLPVLGALQTDDRDRRLAERGMAAGSPVMIRIFKAESQLELWLEKGGRFELFATYPICYWSGTLGPKLHEGDKQAPEGFYSVGMPQIRRRGRWPRSLNIGFPNALDRAYARTGSLILVHGGCTSTGCYAMTNPVMEEIYALSEQALKRGQDRIQVHVFPFRMTEHNVSAHADHEWHGFWLNLKEAYDLFERTRVPPKVSVCGKKYVVTEGASLDDDDGAATLSARRRAAHLFSDVKEAAPSELGDCVELEPDTQSLASPQSARTKKARGRKVASRAHRRRSVGRNARKAYAAARKVRMTAHAKRVRTASGARRSH